MPMLDVYIPDGALSPEAEATLLNRITEIVIGHEGFDPANPLARSATWVFLHRPVCHLYRRGACEGPVLQGHPDGPGGAARREEARGRHRRRHPGDPGSRERRLAARCQPDLGVPHRDPRDPLGR